MTFGIYTNLLLLLAMRSIPRNSYAQVASWNAANHTKVLPRETRRISHVAHGPVFVTPRKHVEVPFPTASRIVLGRDFSQPVQAFAAS
jgi:hypothetical protein